MTGPRWLLPAVLAAAVLVASLGSWAAGAPLRASLAGAALGFLAALLGRAWIGRHAGEQVDALVRFADAQRDGRLDARLPGTWDGAGRPAAAALNAMAATQEARLGASDARRTRLEAVIEAMEEAVLVVDAAERVLLANPRLRELASTAGEGPPPGGRALLEVVRHAEVVDGLRTALRQGEVQVREVAMGPAGDRRVRFHAGPFMQPDGTRGAVAVFHDVTELRRVETVRRDFLANASHELKTPLTSIRGYGERLAEASLPESAAPAVDAIVSNAKRLQALVEDLLELSRIESGSVPLRPERVDVVELAQGLLADLEPRLREAALEVELLAEGDPHAWVDRRAVEQVLGNLLDNAIKYTPGGGRVVVSVGPGSGQRLHLSVADTGIGIPRRDLPRLFERFYRVDPGRSRALGGTGLGLAIVRHLVQAVGGQLGVESEPGRGSRFSVELPRSDGAPARAADR